MLLPLLFFVYRSCQLEYDFIATVGRAFPPFPIRHDFDLTNCMFPTGKDNFIENVCFLILGAFFSPLWLPMIWAFFFLIIIFSRFNNTLKYFMAVHLLILMMVSVCFSDTCLYCCVYRLD